MPARRIRTPRRAVVVTAVATVVALAAGCGVPPDPAGLHKPREATASATSAGTPPRPTGDPTLSDVEEPAEPELVDRRMPPTDAAPVDSPFTATVGPVPRDVVERSTWTEECPVGLAELRYVAVPFIGFDGHTYAGEMIVHADVAADVAGVFERLYEEGFPIEEMRVVSPDELDAPPTGDGNNTTAFVCRATTGGSSWSEHAYGLAIDINPFHNPYVRDDIVIPELATAYIDRDRLRPGMIHAGDEATTAFAEIGWAWGGEWRSLKDWMHFSRSGR